MTTLTITDWIENGDETLVVYSDGETWSLDETMGMLYDLEGKDYDFEDLREREDPTTEDLPEHVIVLLGQIGR